MKLALDVSKYQRGLPVTNTKYNVVGVIVKASDGGAKDEYFEENISAHKKYPISLYHFWRANYSVDIQVSVLLQQVKRAEKLLGYQPTVAIDVENSIGVSIVGRGTAIKRLHDFATKLDYELEKPTYIYTSKSKWAELFNYVTKVRYKKQFEYLTGKYLWNAVYFTNEVLDEKRLDDILKRIENGLDAWYIPDGKWKEMIMWQIGYTDAIIRHANVDVDVVYSDWAFKHDEATNPPPTLEERVKRLEEIVASCC